MKSVRSTDGGSFSLGLRRHASDPRLIRIQVRTLLLTSTKVRPTRLNRHVQSLQGVSIVIVIIVVVVIVPICPFFSFVSSSAIHASLTSCVLQTTGYSCSSSGNRRHQNHKIGMLTRDLRYLALWFKTSRDTHRSFTTFDAASYVRFLHLIIKFIFLW